MGEKWGSLAANSAASGTPRAVASGLRPGGVCAHPQGVPERLPTGRGAGASDFLPSTETSRPWVSGVGDGK